MYACIYLYEYMNNISRFQILLILICNLRFCSQYFCLLYSLSKKEAL